MDGEALMLSLISEYALTLAQRVTVRMLYDFHLDER